MAGRNSGEWGTIWTRLGLRLVRLLVRLPKFALVAVLGLVEGVVRRGGASEEELAPLVEIKEIFRDDPKGRATLRRMIREGRDAQILSFIDGLKKHYRKPPGDPTAAYATVACNEAWPVPKKARVVFIGDHYEFAYLRATYAARDDFEVVERSASPPDALDSVDAIELSLDDPEAAQWLDAALGKGVVVSLHAGAASTEKVLAAYRKAKGQAAPWRVFSPYLYYEPVQRAKAMLVQGVIGEPGTLRVRATLAGRGGAASLEPPFGDHPLRHPAFNHFALLTLFGGPVKRLTAYVQPMDAETGGQALVSVEYAAAGRVGLLECTYAPQMRVRSEFFPHDLEAELCGTDGILWLRRGMAARTQQAPLAVRVGMSAYTIGVESGLREDWAGVYEKAAEDLRGMVGGRTVELLDSDALVSALKLGEAVAEAAATREVVVL